MGIWAGMCVYVVFFIILVDRGSGSPHCHSLNPGKCRAISAHPVELEHLGFPGADLYPARVAEAHSPPDQSSARLDLEHGASYQPNLKL